MEQEIMPLFLPLLLIHISNIHMVQTPLLSSTFMLMVLSLPHNNTVLFANPPSGYPCVANPPPQGFPIPYGGSFGYGSGPSYAYGESEKPKGSKFGVGIGLAMGAAAWVLGGLALAEGTKYVEDMIADDVAEKIEDDLVDQGGYDDYVCGDGF